MFSDIDDRRGPASIVPGDRVTWRPGQGYDENHRGEVLDVDRERAQHHALPSIQVRWDMGAAGHATSWHHPTQLVRLRNGEER